MFAVYNNHPPVLTMLLAKGANVNLSDKNGNTPLMIAAQNGLLNIVRALIARRAKIEVREHKGLTPLILAASKGQTIVVKELSAKGANVNAVSNEGLTALMFAAGKGHLETVKALLAGGADVTITSSHGGTALIAAERTGHTAIAQLLRHAEQSAAGKSGKSVPANQLAVETSMFAAMPLTDVTAWLRDKISTQAVFPEARSVVGITGWQIRDVKFESCSLTLREGYTLSLNILGYYSRDRVNKEYSLSLADIDPGKLVTKRENYLSTVPLFTTGGKRVQRKMVGGESDGQIAMEDEHSFSFRDSELAGQVATAFRRAVNLCRPATAQKPRSTKPTPTIRRNPRVRRP